MLDTASKATACHHYRTGQLLTLAPEGDGYALRPAGAGADEEANLLVAPALVDLQINGYKGVSFTSTTVTCEEVKRVFDEMAAVGVAYLCPTLYTSPPGAMLHGLRTLQQACRRYPDVAAACVGYHLEGPYISPEDGPRGAHPRRWVRDPDEAELAAFQEAADGRVRILTLAPELEGAIPFIARRAAQGVVPALGHCSPTTEQVTAAVDAGARLSTHLGNGAHAVLPRHPNYIWDQLAEHRLYASLIADGFHLPPNVVKVMIRAKGLERAILVSDAWELSGMPPGLYPQDDGSVVEVAPDGRMDLRGTPYLAGANLPLSRCVANAAAFAGIALADAIDMASVNPWRLLGTEPPSLAPGTTLKGAMLCRWRDGRLDVVKLIP